MEVDVKRVIVQPVCEDVQVLKYQLPGKKVNILLSTKSKLFY